MSVYNYKVLEVVAETENFTRAADRLHLTPSAISHTVAKLESEFGFKIFKRSRDGVTLTSEGMSIMPHVRAVIRENDSLAQKASTISGVSEGTIRVGAFYAVTISWLVDIFAEYHRQFPGITIKLFEGGYRDVRDWVDNNVVDIAFISDAIAGDLEYTPLYRDRAVCVVPEDFAPACPDHVTEDDLIDMPLVIQEDYEDVETKKILNICPRLKSNSNFTIEDDNCIMAMVEAGLGVAFMHELSCARRFASVKTYPFYPYVERTIGLHIAHPESISPATEKMKDIIMDYTAKL